MHTMGSNCAMNCSYYALPNMFFYYILNEDDIGLGTGKVRGQQLILILSSYIHYYYYYYYYYHHHYYSPNHPASTTLKLLSTVIWSQGI